LDISREERTTGIDYFRHLTKALAKKNDEFQEPACLYDWLDQERRRLFEKHKRLASIRDVLSHRGIVTIVRWERGKRRLLERVVEVEMPLNTSGVGPFFISYQPFRDWYPSPQDGRAKEPEIIDITAAGVRSVKAAPVKGPYVYGVMKPVSPPRATEEENSLQLPERRSRKAPNPHCEKVPKRIR